MAFGSVLTVVKDAPSERKRRGAFFTPSEMADYLVNWAITSRSSTVLEPACGEAEFLIASYKRLVELGASSSEASILVAGCELHADSARAALARCAAYSFKPEIAVGDFFKQRPTRKFDAIIGNPPYVRFQVLDDKQKNTFKEVSHRTGYALSALASAWAPFVMHSATFLNEGGRLAFVLPAELLTVNYAASIREFLLAEFGDITIVTFDEKVFPEVQEEVVLLLASGYHRGSAEFVKWIQSSDLGGIGEGADRDYYPGTKGARWTPGLVEPVVGSTLGDLDGNGFCRLGDWGRLALGAVTGNNKYFALSADEIEAIGLNDDEVVPVSPPGSSHLRRLAFTGEDHGNLVKQGKKAYLFYPGEDLSEAARRYLDFGKEKEVDRGYKCRKRTPWWKVPVTEAPDAFVTYMNDYAPGICANEAGVRCLNSVHGLTFNEEYRRLGRRLLPLACMNSVTLLSAELEGRAYGGGMLKVEPREAARLQVPSPELVGSHADELEALLGDFADQPVGKDSVELRSRVDEVLFEDVDLVEAATLEHIRDGKQALYDRRRGRGGKR